MPPAVLITGAARRLGRHLALHLAAQGHDLALHHRAAPDADMDSLLAAVRALGVQAVALPADLENEAAVRRLVPQAVQALGRLDAVVNSASLFVHDALHSLDYATLERHARTNTGAALLLTQALHAHLNTHPHANPHTDPHRPPGCVVQVLDQKLWNPNPDHLSYTLSKAALEASIAPLALALAPRLRVVGVALGVTLPSGPMSDAEFAQAHRMTPLGRSSTADDFVRTVAFLLASPAITGTTLLVDGGQHLAAQPRDVFYLLDQKEG